MEETETESELVKLVGEDRSSDFENGEFVCGGEDAVISLDLFTGGERVQETSDGFLTEGGRRYRSAREDDVLRHV